MRSIETPSIDHEELLFASRSSEFEFANGQLKVPMSTDAPHCDEHQIAQFFDGTLSDREQGELTRHIETCSTCRHRMEISAASDEWWYEARDALSGLSNDFELSADATSDANLNPAERSSVPLEFLAPSDNPAMLGRIGEFEILEEIGCGGMGVVLKGYDHELNRFVAVKVLHPFCATSAAARRRFVREAQAAAAIVHQHVVAIHAVDANHHPPYLVMPFVPGESLQQRLARQGTLSLLDGLRIAQQVAEGLAAAHAQGLVHRDIKPGNILLERNVERVLLTDFGLARAADDASLTRSGVVAGTPQYMSPEQARGDDVDHRTDLFSLGTVLYTMFAGHSPFRAESAMGVLRRVCDSTPRQLRDINPEVPEWLEAFITKLHAKQPEDRFSSAQTVARLLQRALAHVQQPLSVSLPDEIKSLVKAPAIDRPRLRWILSATVCAFIIAGVIAASAFIRPNPSPVKTSRTSPPESKSPAIEHTASWSDDMQNEKDQIENTIEQWESDSDF